MKSSKQKVIWCRYFVAFLLSGFACVLIKLSDWFKSTFGVSVQAIAYTITNPIKNADISFLKEAIFICVPVLLKVFLCFMVFFLFDLFVLQAVSLIIEIKTKKKSFSVHFTSVFRFLIIFSSSLAVFFAFYKVDKQIHYVDFIKERLTKTETEIYKEKYIDPKTTQIENNSTKKNLIYIYMESLETTYASKEAGGFQEVNYIPHLTELANKNISFSNTNLLGGWNHVGAGWTMGALFASQSGIPFNFPVNGNAMGGRKYFAKKLTTLGDVLKMQGYTNEFLCGSDGDFAGRKDFFMQHGDFKVFDYFSAIEKDYILPDYKVWWGFEDEILYKIAKDEITALSKGGAPFNFTMLTVDTHHVGGYVCALCANEYPEQLANVVSCADNQVSQFIEWCKTQDFYENTVIVVTGDHDRMDKILVENAPSRPVYNCFINTGKVKPENLYNRVFTAYDIFPTVLSAIGFSIKGDRLALGTDLFSETPTLTEEMGLDAFTKEIFKYSQFYIDNFW